MKVLIFVFFIACTLRAFATTGDKDIDNISEHIRQSNNSENSNNDSKNDSRSQSNLSKTSPDFTVSTNDYGDLSNKSISNKSSEPSSSSPARNELTTSTKTEIETLTQLSNAATPSSSEQQQSSSQSSHVSSSQTISGRHSTVIAINSTSFGSTSPSPSAEEAVVLGTQEPVLIPKTLIQKSIEWMSNAYTLSILLPVASGIVFAATIIVIVAACSCIRRRCRRRRIRKKILPDSVKNMRPSDHARLLADTSDEEF